MKFSHLKEDNISSFADDFKRTATAFADGVKSTVNKNGNEKDGEDKKDEEDTDDKKQDGDNKDAEKEEHNAKSKVDASTKNAPFLIAHIILDRTPDEHDLPEFDYLNAEEFENLQIALHNISAKFQKFNSALSKAILASDLVNALDKKYVLDRLNDENPKVADAAETMLMQNKNGEKVAWETALLCKNPNEGTKALLELVKKISDANAKKNEINPNKVLATGLMLLNVLGAQRQILDIRLDLMKTVLEKTASANIKKDEK